MNLGTRLYTFFYGKYVGKDEYGNKYYIEFKNGLSTFTCSTQLASYQKVNILGTKGRIEIEIPFNAPQDKECKIIHQYEDKLDEISFELCDQYTLQGDLFSMAVLNNTKVPTPISDSLANMNVLEKILNSSQSNSWSVI